MFRDTLRKTRQSFFGRVANLLGATELSDQTWDEIEALLIQADLGVETALGVVERLRARVRDEGLTTRDQLQSALKEELVGLLPTATPIRLDRTRLLNVVLIVGVNGSGKTTTIAKLAKRYVGEGWRVMLAAADTFRAAAEEQLEQWGERV